MNFLIIVLCLLGVCLGSKIIGKYRTSPSNLFRIGTSKKVLLREYFDQKSKGKFSYDYTLKENGLILPAEGEEFIGPNGMSLRPVGTLCSYNNYDNALIFFSRNKLMGHTIHILW